MIEILSYFPEREMEGQRKKEMQKQRQKRVLSKHNM
jgi:hypothetical protein